MHYVSTSPTLSRQNSQQSNCVENNMYLKNSVENPRERKSTVSISEVVEVECTDSEPKNKLLVDSELNKNSNKKSRAAYFREYRAKNTDSLKKAKLNEKQRQYRTKKSCPEEQAKLNEYNKQHRAKNANPEKRLKPTTYLLYTTKTNKYKREYRAKNASPEKKAKINEYNKQYIAKKPCQEVRTKRKTYMKNYRLRKASKDKAEDVCKQTIECCMSNFHKLVNQGPLYICICCDQLWYKHSVSDGRKLKISKPEIAKYLCDKTSVDDKEWICRTCHSYLIKNKVPPCGILNGMKFPPKPDFFDLNELQCRLLSPRIAFQKLMQAPRGNQLKIHGNIVNVPGDVTNTVRVDKISDWFYRVEYQQRGSPHIHMLIWLDGAPQFKVDRDKDVTAFIDNIITCQKAIDDACLPDLVNGRQIHRHCHTCRKNTRSQFRFNYPQPPLRETMIIYPLDNETPDSEIKMHKDNWKTIKKYLDDMIEGEDISFEQLLLNLNVSEEDYLNAIRSSLNTPTVFLKRNPNELRVNNYNAACLKAWRANMDIQFVLDVYGCAVYIVRDIGSKFVNNVEISAQEAVYTTLQIYTSGLIKRYCERPAKLENVTLADWAAWYDSSGKPYVKQTDEIDFDGLPLESFVDDNQNDDDYELQSNTGKSKKRNKARIIRSVWFNKESDPEKHYRELLMLFTSWHNEEIDLLSNCSSYQERFIQVHNMVDEQMKQYAVCREDFSDIELAMNRMEDRYDTLAPSTQSIEHEDSAEGNQDLHPDFNENYNLSDDLGILSVNYTEPLTMNELPDEEYRHMVQTLNKEQKELFYHVLHLIKTSDEPFYCFLSGGAGVGK
ncbi:hypothetical protein AC249_AIPGENE17524 [Exaiptasia diaphana]|nr:hypothetical protein AC249_AIPGENE17524 [Exaiptasia diaphana]